MKNYIIKSVYTIIFILLIISCASTKFTKSKFGKYEYDSINKDIIELKITLVPLVQEKKPEVKPKTFFDLRDSIPNTLLRVLGEKPGTAKGIIDLIKEPLSPDEKKDSGSNSDKSKSLNFTNIKVRLYLSQIKKFYNDGELLHDNTRLEYLTSRITLKSNNAKILTIDKLENQIETIDFGTLERTNDVTFNASVDPDYGITKTSTNQLTESNENQTVETLEDIVDSIIQNREDKNTSTTELRKGVKAQLAYKNNEIIKENIKLNRGIVKTGFSFDNQEIVIAQRGRPLVGIPENTILTATLKFRTAYTKDFYTFTKLFESGKNSWNLAKNIKVVQNKIVYNPCTDSNEDTIKFNLKYEGLIRSVKNKFKGNNIAEFDDRVKFLKFNKDINTAVKIDNRSFCKILYNIRSGYEYEKDDQKGMKLDRLKTDVLNKLSLEINTYKQDSTTNKNEYDLRLDKLRTQLRNKEIDEKKYEEDKYINEKIFEEKESEIKETYDKKISDIKKQSNKHKFSIEYNFRLKIEKDGISDVLLLYEFDEYKKFENWVNKIIESLKEKDIDKISKSKSKLRKLTQPLEANYSIYFESLTPINGKLEKVYLINNKMGKEDLKKIQKLLKVKLIEDE